MHTTMRRNNINIPKQMRRIRIGLGSVNIGTFVGFNIKYKDSKLHSNHNQSHGKNLVKKSTHQISIYIA